MKNALSRLAASFTVASLALVTGCGGGGGGTTGLQSAGGLVPSAPATTQPHQAWEGPVGYLQSSSPLVSTGAITQGTQQAIVAVMSGEVASGNSYSPDNLTVNTQGKSSSSLRRTSGVRSRRSLVSQVVPVEAHPADDSALLAELRGIGVSGGRQFAERRRESVVPSNPVVGSTASVWVEDGVGSNYSVQVPATLVVQTAHGNIWIDNTLRGTPAWTNAAQIGTDFENGYASDTAHFAHPDYPSSAPGLQAQYQSCDSTGHVVGSGSGYITEPADHRVDVMVVNSGDLGGYGGYFSAANLMNQSALNCLNGSYESNEAPFIFVGWFQSQSSAYELQEDMVRGAAHELQHLINFVNHALLPQGASSPSFNGTESTFINEGLSMLAQDLAVQKMYGAQGVNFDADDALARADAYLASPGNFSISTFAGIDSAEWGGGGSPRYNCFGGCYGGAYLFERYLHDRFGGDTYTHAIESSGAVGAQNLQTVTGESASDLLDDFALAMAANTLGVNNSGKFSFGSLALSGSYPDQFGEQKMLGGLYAAPLSAGGSLNVQAPLGGFTFVSVAGVPQSGVPLTVTDHASVGGFALAGGLAEH